MRTRSFANTRDLVAYTRYSNAIDQGWRDDNPVLPRMRRIKKRRDPIMLLTLTSWSAAAPASWPTIIRAAIATGARQDELLKARREHIDHCRRQMTLVFGTNGIPMADMT